MILVTGSTGTVGRQVVAQLLAAGEKVRAMTRNPAKANFDGQVEVIQGDFAGDPQGSCPRSRRCILVDLWTTNRQPREEPGASG